MDSKLGQSLATKRMRPRMCCDSMVQITRSPSGVQMYLKVSVDPKWSKMSQNLALVGQPTEINPHVQDNNKV